LIVNVGDVQEQNVHAIYLGGKIKNKGFKQADPTVRSESNAKLYESYSYSIVVKEGPVPPEMKKSARC
jgi:hypothetical protein